MEQVHVRCLPLTPGSGRQLQVFIKQSSVAGSRTQTPGSSGPVWGPRRHASPAPVTRAALDHPLVFTLHAPFRGLILEGLHVPFQVSGQMPPPQTALPWLPRRLTQASKAPPRPHAALTSFLNLLVLEVAMISAYIFSSPLSCKLHKGEDLILLVISVSLARGRVKGGRPAAPRGQVIQTHLIDFDIGQMTLHRHHLWDSPSSSG